MERIQQAETSRNGLQKATSQHVRQRSKAATLLGAPVRFLSKRMRRPQNHKQLRKSNTAPLNSFDSSGQIDALGHMESSASVQKPLEVTIATTKAQHVNKEDSSSLEILRNQAIATIEMELNEIRSLKERVDDQFLGACQAIRNCKGRVIVTGMGKSGLIGTKIAATLASTGTPAFFVHAGEASHGDLGMIVDGDVVIVLSNSGKTEEVMSIVPILQNMNITIVALTGNPSSPLAQAAHFHIDNSVYEEACPLGLAPTASTTAALILGDALAMAVMQARGFTAQEFARSHPGGRIGHQARTIGG